MPKEITKKNLDKLVEFLSKKKLVDDVKPNNKKVKKPSRSA